MTQDLILANATLVLPDEVVVGCLRIRDDCIVSIDLGGGVPAGAIDCELDYVAPGLIELHTDNLERHIEPRPKIDWPHAAAILAHDAELASCGITTVFDAMRLGFNPNSKTDRTSGYARDLSQHLWDMRAKDMLKISHFLHLRAEVCSETLIAELDQFGASDRVGLVSLMDHTPGQRQFHDMDKLEAYVRGKRGLDHNQFLQHVAGLKQIRDRVGDANEIATVAAAARFNAVLASHDDTTIEQVNTSAGYGIRLAEFPTTINAAKACHDHNIAVMMGAPNLIRRGSHSGNVAAHVLADLGLLDVLSSDYIPAALLQSAVRLGCIWGSMAKGIATVTRAPARSTGLSDRGTLDIGKRGDVIRFSVREDLAILRQVYVRGQRVA
jgi:alpha-D-ribose 1-methylphosphonate 5-triphosphate diphosphatase